MRVILFSVVVYLLGVAVVLFLRPRLMFQEDGRWKEFGLRDEATTPFPFWLYCLVWAMISYFLTSVLIADTPVNITAAATTAATVASASQAATTRLPAQISEAVTGKGEENEMTNAQLLKPLPPAKNQRRNRSESVGSASEAPKKGFYKLTGGGKKGGVPRYIYLGSEPPSDAED
jgi:hypothetical protein